ncbi:MAG: sodium:calcium antiporter [bacterium]
MFALFSVIIYLAGSRMTYYGDVLGEKWSVERSFIGLILLSTVTSLPEMGTSLASIIVVDSPNLALGNVLGSNMFNILIIPLIIIVCWDNFLDQARPKQTTTGNLVLFLYGLVGLALISDLFGWSVYRLLNVGMFSGLIFIVYLFGLYMIFSDSGVDPEQEADLEEAELYTNLNESAATTIFIVCALLVIGSGAGLAQVGKVLAVETGLGETFFGSLFFAFVTSLPEFVVSLAAIRQLQAANLAVGNVVGSCLFNLGIIFIYEVAALDYPVFTQSSNTHLVSVFAGILLVSTLTFSIQYRQSNPTDSPITFETIGIIAIYISAMYFLGGLT